MMDSHGFATPSRSGQHPAGAEGTDAVLQALRGQLQRWEQVARPAREGRISSGCRALDDLLPGGGFRRGTLVEWLAEQPASGAGTLALIVAREACREGGALVVLEGGPAGGSRWQSAHPPRGQTPCSAGAATGTGRASRRNMSQPAAGERDSRCLFNPAAAALWGIDLERLVVVRPQRERDLLWALDQALRSGGVAAVWAPLSQLDQHTFRRLRLAVEESGGLGLLLRPADIRGRPSWSDLQLLVQPQASRDGRRLRVQLVRGRGVTAGGRVELKMDEATGALREAGVAGDETHARHLAAQLAHPAPRRRATRA